MFLPLFYWDQSMAETIVKQHRYYWEDADHLIRLAREYQAKVRDLSDENERDYYLYWKFRLARMSFIARMMSIEALLNNVLEQFSVPRKFKELSQLGSRFARKERFPRNQRKRKGRPYQVPLKWKMYVTPYVCNEDSRMEVDEYFIYEEGAYRKFRQLIMIRNEFVHTRVVEKDIDIQMRSGLPMTEDDRLQKLLINHEFADCCEELGIEKDPVCFRIDNAVVCSEAMRGILVELDHFLGGRILTKDFWESDELDFSK
jgi:hypothetical protein